LCGIAELPFWPGVEELLRLAHLAALQVAHLGREPLERRGDDAERGEEGAWRSRGMTWVETGSTARPSLRATCASTRGSTLAKVPTGPEIAQVAISARAATRRSRLRANSA
jgi:hypothetical protein